MTGAGSLRRSSEADRSRPRGHQGPGAVSAPRRTMRRHLTVALRALIVAAVPAVLVGNALWLLVSPGFVEAHYAVVGSPEGIERLSPAGERQLGLSGARAVRPGGEGVKLLERATLDDGTPALTDREVLHMRDVRTVMTGFFAGWGVALVAATASALALRRSAGGRATARAFARGADVTLVATVLLALGMVLDFGALFASLHGIFFTGDSWRFPADSTLLNLYPQRFWIVAGATAAVLTVLQALLIAVVMRRMLLPERPWWTARR